MRESRYIYDRNSKMFSIAITSMRKEKWLRKSREFALFRKFRTAHNLIIVSRDRVYSVSSYVERTHSPDTVNIARVGRYLRRLRPYIVRDTFDRSPAGDFRVACLCHTRRREKKYCAPQERNDDAPGGARSKRIAADESRRDATRRLATTTAVLRRALILRGI